MNSSVATKQSKDAILEAIQRTARENGGAPLGRRRFAEETAIGEGAWRGIFWARWSDAILEAGFSPNKPLPAHDKTDLVARLAMLTIRLKHFPTEAETKLERHADPTFPNSLAFQKLGALNVRIDLVRILAEGRPELRESLAYLPEQQGHGTEETAFREGAVYMLRLGKHYKIGKSFSVPRRHREISLELPEKPEIVHVITTDDPGGIEAYWHKRFEDRRTNGEWFSLTPGDIQAFRRRKFM